MSSIVNSLRLNRSTISFFIFSKVASESNPNALINAALNCLPASSSLPTRSQKPAKSPLSHNSRAASFALILTKIALLSAIVYIASKASLITSSDALGSIDIVLNNS
jgi:hypothetical protein